MHHTSIKHPPIYCSHFLWTQGSATDLLKWKCQRPDIREQEFSVKVQSSCCIDTHAHKHKYCSELSTVTSTYCGALQLANQKKMRSGGGHCPSQQLPVLLYIIILDCRAASCARTTRRLIVCIHTYVYTCMQAHRHILIPTFHISIMHNW